MVIMGIDFKSLKDEIENSPSSPSLSQTKTWGSDFLRCSSSIVESFLEREGTSL